MKSKHKGAHSEHLAITWLLSQGYDVFRNVSPHGHADLIAWLGDDVIKIDVKTLSFQHNKGGTSTPYWTNLTKEQKEEGVKLLLVPPTSDPYWG